MMKEDRFVQIESRVAHDALCELFALDGCGVVWWFDRKARGWRPLEQARLPPAPPLSEGVGGEAHPDPPTSYRQSAKDTVFTHPAFEPQPKAERPPHCKSEKCLHPYYRECMCPCGPCVQARVAPAIDSMNRWEPGG